MRLFFLLTGQRDEAVRTMKWENVDFKRERIHYPEPKGGPEAAFDLPMSAPVKQVLEWVRTFSEADWAFPGSEWVWPTLEKESRQTTHVYTSREPGKPELRGAHDLRRTFITTGYEVASYKFISYLANHACKDSITDDYFNPQQEAVKNALETVDAAIISKLGVSVETLLGPQKLDTTAKFRASQANVA
jgi:integrase